MRDYEIVDKDGEIILEVRAKSDDGARTAAWRYFHANVLNKEIQAWQAGGFHVRVAE
jgi:hypothetical protein